MDLNLEGYTDLPPGKLAAVVTYLEMTAPAALDSPLPPNFRIVRAHPPDLNQYRQVFRAIGEPWLWFSRLTLNDHDLAAAIQDAFFLYEGETIRGLFELDPRHPPDIELTFFGLTPDAVGHGLGRSLMASALDEVWRHRPGTRRFWLHTCTLDHPGALSFYRKCGFRPYRRALEIASDPRLDGRLSRDIAPQIPIL